jgi:hypothetical protein
MEIKDKEAALSRLLVAARQLKRRLGYQGSWETQDFVNEAAANLLTWQVRQTVDDYDAVLWTAVSNAIRDRQRADRREERPPRALVQPVDDAQLSEGMDTEELAARREIMRLVEERLIAFEQGQGQPHQGSLSASQPGLGRIIPGALALASIVKYLHLSG